MIEITAYEIYNGRKSDRFNISLIAEDETELNMWRYYLKQELKVKYIHLIYKENEQSIIDRSHRPRPRDFHL